MLSDQAVMIADAQGREANWHDPYCDESDIEAARIGGYVIRANTEPAEILSDFRGAPRTEVNGHEYVTANDRDVRVCLRHATCAEAGESCPDTGDEIVLALFTREELRMLRDSCEITIQELDRPEPGTEDRLAALITKLGKLDAGDVFGERCACPASIGGVRFPHARSLHNLPQPAPEMRALGSDYGPRL